MKVLIKGDTHFDLTTGSFNRNEEIKVAYKAIIDYAIKNDIKCFVDLGDEFDNRVIEDYSVPAFIVGQLNRLKKNDIEIIRVRGNHDYPRSKKEQTVGTMLDELLEVSGITNKRNIIDHTRIGDLFITTVGWIYPFAAGGDEVGKYIENELFSISPYLGNGVAVPRENDPKRWIVCAHLNPPYVKAGEHETQIKFDGPSIPIGVFNGFGEFDAVFLGHIHNSSTTHEYGDKDIPCVFPGSIINTSFGDKGERGFVVYDSDTSGIETVRLDALCEVKEMVVVEYMFKATDTESAKKEINTFVKEIVTQENLAGDGSIVKYVITINGVSPTGINTSVLKKELISLSSSVLNVAYVRSVEFKFDEDKKVVEQHKAKALLKAVTVEDKVTEYMKLYKPPSEDVVRKVVGRIK